MGLVCCSNFYTTPGEMGGGALGGSLQRARRYEAPMTPFLAARCELVASVLHAASCFRSTQTLTWAYAHTDGLHAFAYITIDRAVTAFLV